MGRSWCRSHRLCLLFLALLFVLCSGQPSPPSSPRPERDAHADALLARMCDPRSSRPASVPLSWCHELRLRRRHGGGRHRRPAPLPPPGREEVDVRYGVAKRLVPTGPNPLHN